MLASDMEHRVFELGHSGNPIVHGREVALSAVIQSITDSGDRIARMGFRRSFVQSGAVVFWVEPKKGKVEAS